MNFAQRVNNKAPLGGKLVQIISICWTNRYLLYFTLWPPPLQMRRLGLGCNEICGQMLSFLIGFCWLNRLQIGRGWEMESGIGGRPQAMIICRRSGANPGGSRRGKKCRGSERMCRQ